MATTVNDERFERQAEQTSLADRVVPLPLLLSLCAVLISVAALMWSIYHDPLRPHLTRYDFSTPKASMISMLELSANNDIGSRLALDRLFNQRQLDEKLRTVAVHKEAEWRGNKILFVSYEQDGVKKYSTESFTKDADSGYWKSSYVVSYLVNDDDKALSEMMSSWEKKGRLE